MTRRARVLIGPAGRHLATVSLADTARSRAVGLLGRDRLGPGDGLVLAPCRLIHTFFMRFAIDVIFLDRAGQVTCVHQAVRPFRFAWGGWAARTTIELAAGSLSALDLPFGTEIRLEVELLRR